MRPTFITGIGTDIGKTLISAVLTEKFKTNYWKPVQCGDLNFTDTQKVESLISNRVSIFHPEAYRLKHPSSPHKAAALEGIIIDPARFALPDTGNKLIIEGAGGLLVPLTTDYFIADLIKQLSAQVILVSKMYLGSINHTLMSIETLRSRNIPIKGIVFNGEGDKYSEDVIRKYGNVLYFANIPQQQIIDRSGIIRLGSHFESWNLD